MTVFSVPVPERQDPARNAVNREPARAVSFPLARIEDALVAGVPETPYVQSLNGIWKFHWCGAANQRPQGIERADFDDSRWTTIDVPCCVERRGFGVPHYIAHGYPHPVTPPTIDDSYNPVSSYLQALHYTWEDLEFAWHRRRETRRYNVQPPRAEVYLNLDIQQLGQGGASCGPGPLKKYAFPAKPEHWTLSISPL